MSADPATRRLETISEAAREKEWKLPSFGKALYLGDFQPELISPQPELPAEAIEKGERFLAVLGAFLRDEVDPQAIERDGRISDEVVAGFKEIGALGMKVPEQYGGLGLSQVYYNRALMLAGNVALQRLDAAVGAPVDRAGAAPAAVRLGGAEARVAAEGLHYARCPPSR